MQAFRFLFEKGVEKTLWVLTVTVLLLQDKFRMCGARAFRHVFLFKRAIIIAKKKAEGLLLVKAFIMVR